MKRKWMKHYVIREGVTIPLMIILYGIPAVLIILFAILITLGVRLMIRKCREIRREKSREREEQLLSGEKEMLEPVVGWEEEPEAVGEE